MKATKAIRIKENEKKWHLIDADGKTLGRLASNIAKILMGKNKPEYTPNYDNGDYVVVVNAEKVHLTGRKYQTKTYRYYTGYTGGQKHIKYEDMVKKHPDRIIIHAVKGMLPKNKLASKMIKKLKVYKGKEHKHSAQNPEEIVVTKEKNK